MIRFLHTDSGASEEEDAVGIQRSVLAPHGVNEEESDLCVEDDDRDSRAARSFDNLDHFALG